MIYLVNFNFIGTILFLKDQEHDKHDHGGPEHAHRPDHGPHGPHGNLHGHEELVLENDGFISNEWLSYNVLSAFPDKLLMDLGEVRHVFSSPHTTAAFWELGQVPKLSCSSAPF